MSAPAFSTFSAITELFVTAAVFYVIHRAVRHDDLRVGLLASALVYEVVVNIAYMVGRMIGPASPAEHSPAMGALLAGHGLLSLAMFLGLIALFVTAIVVRRRGRNLLREQPALTRAFVVLWSLSVASGEAIYVLLYWT